MKLFFYMGTTLDKFSRKYQKIQEVIAVVGGFLKICQIAIKILLVPAFTYFKSLMLINGTLNIIYHDEKSDS